MDNIAVALLAAGRSQRFGQEDKLLAPLGGRPLISWTLEAARSVPAARRLLVTSPGSALTSHAPDFDQLINDDPGSGLSSSLTLAVSVAAQSASSALLILLADMPFVTTRHLDRLVERLCTGGGKPVFSHAAGISHPPALFPAPLFPAMLEASGDSGARALAEQAQLVPLSLEEALDIDTRSDLARAEAIVARL